MAVEPTANGVASSVATTQRGRRRKKFALRKPRTCDQCGKRYHRRNQTELWTVRNPGHRLGWEKQVLRICNECVSPAQAVRILGTLQIPTGRVLQGSTRRA